MNLKSSLSSESFNFYLFPYFHADVSSRSQMSCEINSLTDLKTGFRVLKSGQERVQ